MEEEKASGSATDVLGSVTAHLHDRLKSPFAGAFLFSWVAWNWQALMVLLLSSDPIRDRVKEASNELTIENSIGMPLVCAFGVILAVHIGTAAFLFIGELADLAKSWIRRGFDKRGWMKKETALRQRTGLAEAMMRFRDLAADHESEVGAERAKVAELEQQVAKLDVEVRKKADNEFLLKSRLENAERSVHSLKEELQTAKMELDGAMKKDRVTSFLNVVKDELMETDIAVDRLQSSIAAGKEDTRVNWNNVSFMYQEQTPAAAEQLEGLRSGSFALVRREFLEHWLASLRIVQGNIRGIGSRFDHERPDVQP